MTPVILIQSDVIQLLANIMESVDREDITFACNTCQICHKSFHTKGSLKQHGDIHAEVKKFPCLLCNKTFSRVGYLKTHKLAHTGEKPHQCTSC